MKPDEIAAQSAALNEVVTGFNGNWSQLENEMAGLLHQVLFCKTNYLMRPFPSGIAHAIYFTPDGFAQRQNIVNNAVTEWLAENQIATFDYLPAWNKINRRLGTLRGTRNLLAHGSVQAVEIRRAI